MMSLFNVGVFAAALMLLHPGIGFCGAVPTPEESIAAAKLAEESAAKLIMEGRFLEAVQVVKAALANAEHALNKEPQLRIQLVMQLGWSHLKTGKLGESAVNYSTAVRLAEAIPGNPAHNLVPPLTCLAVSYSQLGRLVEAETVQRRAYNIETEAHSEPHYHTALVTENLADLLLKKHDWDGSIQLSLQALNIFEGLGMRISVDSGICLANLAEAKLELGNLQAGLRHAADAVKVKLAAAGPNHPTTANGYLILARALRLSGQCAKALEVAHQGATIHRTSSGEFSMDLADAIEEIGKSESDLGRKQDAKAHLDQAASIRARNKGHRPLH